MKRLASTASTLGLAALFVSPLTTYPEDWPRWLGPNGDNIAPRQGAFTADLNSWKVAWEAQVGLGYSAVTVAQGRALTLGHDGQGKETVFCFDAATGEEKWKFTYDADLIARMHPGGPNASPTVAGPHVFTVSKDGQVHCLTLEEGKIVWRNHLPEVLGVNVPSWGFSSSPVIDQDRVLLSAGKVAALDAATGKTLWTSANEYHPGYTTPVVFQRGQDSYIAALGGKELTVLSAKDGAEIVRHPFKAQFDMVATTPVILDQGSRIFISGNLSAEMLAFDGHTLSPAWTSKDIRNAMNNSVFLNGAFYGVDGKQGNSRSRLVSVQVADGKVNWAREDFGYGTTIGVGTSLLALTEEGELVLVQPNPASYEETSRRKVLDKTCWTNPVFAGDRIYVRNDKGHLVCLTAP